MDVRISIRHRPGSLPKSPMKFPNAAGPYMYMYTSTYICRPYIHVYIYI